MALSLSVIKQKLFSDKLVTPSFLDVKYIASLDGLRAFAIVFVIIAHLNFELQNNYIASVFMGGVLGVRIFFVISGFLITTLLLKEKIATNTISLKKFYIRRFLRILPVYLLAIFVIFILDLVFNLNIAGRFYAYVLTFTENFDSEKHWYTRHFWSLSVEEQFYLIFPFIIKKNLNFFIGLSVCLIALCPVITFLFFHQQYLHNTQLVMLVKGAYIFLAPGLITILIGSLSAIILFKFSLRDAKPTWILTILQLIALFVIWYCDKSPLFFAGLIRDLLIVLLLVSVMRFNTVLYKLLNTSALKTVGVLSYSIYIWQQLFTHQQPWATSFKYGTALWFNLPVLLVVAYLSYHYFEKPFLKLKTKFATVKAKPVTDI